MLERGMYCSLNYKSQQREQREVKIVCQRVLSLNSIAVEEEEASNRSEVAVLMRIDGASLFETLRRLTTESKFKIINFLVLR